MDVEHGTRSWQENGGKKIRRSGQNHGWQNHGTDRCVRGAEEIVQGLGTLRCRKSCPLPLFLWPFRPTVTSSRTPVRKPHGFQAVIPDASLIGSRREEVDHELEFHASMRGWLKVRLGAAGRL